MRRIVIPRRFAIATKEVTVEQFRRFGKQAKVTNHPFLLLPSAIIRFSPGPQGPWSAPDWYSAAHYCNWLSEQEGVPRDQWCYLPNEAGAYAEGMSIPADVLERTGYRVPTEAEWEYACRAGAATSRYYGASIGLLGAYAWYQANSKDHAWACGSLLPNDLGLFDMLGNQFEWTQSGVVPRWRKRKGVFNDIINTIEYISEKNDRVSRGGSYSYPPAFVRSAYQHRSAPAYRGPYYDFRPCRTCK